MTVTTTTTTTTHDLTQRFIAAMNAKNFATTQQLLADHFTFSTPEGAAGDTNAFAVFLDRWGTGFPDFAQTPDLIVADADSSATSFLFTGTNDGQLQTVDGNTVPATGKNVEVAAAIFCQWQDGLLANVAFFWDQIAVLTQLGLL